MLGCGEGEEGLGEAGAGEPVEGEPALEPAVNVVPDSDPVGCLRVALLLLQERCLVGVRRVRCDDLEQPSGQVLERLGVEVSGEVEQVLLSLRHQLGVEVLGEGGESAEDRVGLLDVDPSVGQRGPGRLVGHQPLREPGLPVRVPAREPVPVRQPVRRRGGPGLGGQLDRGRMGQDPGLQLRGLSLQRFEVGQGLGGIDGGHRPDRLPTDGRQRLPSAQGRCHHPVRRRSRDRCHGSSTPSPADIAARGCGEPAAAAILGMVRGQARAVGQSRSTAKPSVSRSNAASTSVASKACPGACAPGPRCRPSRSRAAPSTTIGAVTA